MEFGLSENITKILKDFFSNFQEIKEVKIYGSRAKGNFKKGSDIDFALFGNFDKNILAKITFEIDELPTPYKFDITDYKSIENIDLKDHIDRVGKVFYKKG